MSTDLDQRLRAALHAVPRQAPPAGLAASALTRARRRRRHAVTGVVALVAVLAAAAVTVPAVVLHKARTQAAAPALGRFVVAGYASRDPAAATAGLGRYQLYQRSSAGYPTAPGQAAVPSPDGRTVALLSAQGRVGLVPADRVFDPSAVRPVPAPGFVTDVVWSPDSRRLLVPGLTRTVDSRGTATTLVPVVDAATRTTQRVDVSSSELPSGPTQVVFGPRVDGVATLDTGTLRTWGHTGRRSILAVPVLDLPDQPFSPSGTLLAGHAGDWSRVVDLASGAVLGTVDGQVAGWYDEQHLVVMTDRSVRVVDYRSGKVLVERELAAPGRLLTGVWLTPVAGSAPPGAVVV